MGDLNLSLKEFIKKISSDEKYKDSKHFRQLIPARKSKYLNLSEEISPEVIEAMAGLDIVKLFTHQAKAIEKIRDGYNVMLVTGTASGKSICYLIPIVEKILKDESATSLCLYPTKALAQDQLRLFLEWGKPLNPATYDADSSPQEKIRTRQEANVILTNPDMLHHGILPNHNLWGDFFLNLKYVVIDETHILKGVFGSNVGLVIRRLFRLCHHYKSKPQFILTSATLSKPEVFAQRLLGQEVVVINDDGSPSGSKDFFLWNPPIIDEILGLRKSANFEAARLLAELIRHQTKTIVFSKSRQTAELILKYVREELEDNPNLRQLISSYRGGYMPKIRREIEKALFNGQILGVSSTNALELGVDIGGLDACLINVFPGTISSTWQQAGRAGRGTEHSVVFLIGHDDPLDQYYINNPDYFFGKSHEEALINLQNETILKKHLLCAAYEKALTEEDLNLFGEKSKKLLDTMLQEEMVNKKGKNYYWAGHGYPAAQVNIRSASQETYQIIDQSNGEILGDVDDSNVFIYLHPGAVYLHLGETYLVNKLDLNQKVALVSPADCEYYTQPKDYTVLKILEQEMKKKAGQFDLFFGQVQVTKTVTGFQRKNIYDGQVLSAEDLNLPPQTFNTESCWYVLPAKHLSILDLSHYQLAGALHALEHAMIALLPIFAICDRWDLGGVSVPEHEQTGLPTIFIYDAYSGGIGLSRRGYEVCLEHLQSTEKLIADCSCQLGCPSCIQSPKCGNLNEPLDKEAAIKILKQILKNINLVKSDKQI